MRSRIFNNLFCIINNKLIIHIDINFILPSHTFGFPFILLLIDPIMYCFILKYSINAKLFH